jgi:hypothetical protein
MTVPEVNLDFSINCKIFVPGKSAIADLHKEFRLLLIEESKKIGASWKVLDYFTRNPWGEIKHEDVGITVSNIAMDDVSLFKEVIAEICKKLELQLAQG